MVPEVSVHGWFVISLGAMRRVNCGKEGMLDAYSPQGSWEMNKVSISYSKTQSHDQIFNQASPLKDFYNLPIMPT